MPHGEVARTVNDSGKGTVNDVVEAEDEALVVVLVLDSVRYVGSGEAVRTGLSEAWVKIWLRVAATQRAEGRSRETGTGGVDVWRDDKRIEVVDGCNVVAVVVVATVEDDDEEAITTYSANIMGNPGYYGVTIECDGRM